MSSVTPFLSERAEAVTGPAAVVPLKTCGVEMPLEDTVSLPERFFTSGRNG